MMITEQQYLSAIRVINEYTAQIKKQTEWALKKTGIDKTPTELFSNGSVYFPEISVRLKKTLIANFPNKRLCDITKEEFLKTPFVGKKSWTELCDLTGKNSW